MTRMIMQHLNRKILIINIMEYLRMCIKTEHREKVEIEVMYTTIVLFEHCKVDTTSILRKNIKKNKNNKK